MKNHLNINESFICRIWEGHKKYCHELYSDEGIHLEVLDIGNVNHDGGPDYIGAVILIGGKTLRGDVEIHRDYDSWGKHAHKIDKKYNSVILQVILWNKGKSKPELYTKRHIPTVILSEFLKYSIHDIWQEIINNPVTGFHIKCSELEKKYDESAKRMLDKTGIERLKLKTGRMKDRLEDISRFSELDILKNEVWEQLLYEYIFEALGYSKNKDQFLELSKNLNIFKLKAIFRKFKNIDAVRASLFGYAGFLSVDKTEDDYKNKMKDLFSNIRNNIKCGQLTSSNWQFFRLRPQNFPTVRLAYGAHFIFNLINNSLLSRIIELFEGNNIKKIYKALTILLKPPSDNYWNMHSNFGKRSKVKFNLLGSDRINEIIINVILPFMNLYAELNSQTNFEERAFDLYNNLKIVSNNKIIRLLKNELPVEYKLKFNSPALSQGAIQLYSFYCLRDRCTSCIIGKDASKSSGYNYKIIYY